MQVLRLRALRSAQEDTFSFVYVWLGWVIDGGEIRRVCSGVLTGPGDLRDAAGVRLLLLLLKAHNW